MSDKQPKAELQWYDTCGKHATNTQVNRHARLPQDTVNAARDAVKKANDCANTAEDKDGQDRLVSVTDLAWAKAKSAWYRYVKNDERQALAADNEFDNNWEHYGVEDAAVDVGFIILGGGVGGFVGRGVIGAMGRAVTKQAIGTGATVAAHAVEHGGKAIAITGAEQVAARATQAGVQLSQKGDDLIKAGKHTADVMKHGSPKGQAELAKQAERVAGEMEKPRGVLDALRKHGFGDGQKAVELGENLEKLGAKHANILTQTTAAKTQRTALLNTLAPKVKSTEFVAGAVVGVVGRDAFVAPKRQEGAKKSTDVRIEMDEIAEALQKKGKKVTAQNLVDVHTALKRHNLDKGAPDKHGLDANEEKALPGIIDKLNM